MRKITSRELALLVGAMTVGHYAFAQDDSEELPVSNFEDIIVNEVYTTPSDVTTDSYEAPTGPTGGGSVPLAADQSHAIDCAKKYGSYQPNPNYTTTFTQLYGWSIHGSAPLIWEVTIGSTSPPLQGNNAWTSLEGITLGTGKTYLFRGGYTGTPNVINTLEHEWAHQNGADEQTATAAGNEAQVKYQNDLGSKCGGL